MSTTIKLPTTNEVWNILNKIPDPEIPVISIVELGVVRDLEINGSKILVVITPTYTGCPATKFFENDITAAMKSSGFIEVAIKYQYNPAWTTDWLNEESREKLRKYGIAPPDGQTTDKNFLLGKDPQVVCPQCKSKSTKMISQFGSTACKSLHQCKDCLETFDYFKCI